MALSMPKYEIHFENRSDLAYHFGVYQDYPSSSGLESVVWQVRGLPPGSTNKVSWSINYGVAIADWDEDDSGYSGLQIIEAELGNTYHVTLENGDIPAINPTPAHSEVDLPNNQISLYNGTTRSVKLGFAINGSLIAKTDSGNTQWARYNYRPAFHVALYQFVKHGDSPYREMRVGPIKVEFTDGNTEALVECFNQNGSIVFQTGIFRGTEDDRQIFEASTTELVVRNEKFEAYQSGKSVHQTSEKNVIVRTFKHLLSPHQDKETKERSHR